MTLKGKGFTVSGTGTSMSFNNLNLTFKGSPAADLVVSNATAVVGTLTGKISGDTPLGTKSATLTKQAQISSDDIDLSTPVMNADVVQSTTKMSIFGDDVQGSGSIKKDNSFTANLKGIGFNKGFSASLSGTMGTVTNPVPIGSNTPSFTAPSSITIKTSKIEGQYVTGTSTSISAALKVNND